MFPQTKPGATCPDASNTFHWTGKCRHRHQKRNKILKFSIYVIFLFFFFYRLIKCGVLEKCFRKLYAWTSDYGYICYFSFSLSLSVVINIFNTINILFYFSFFFQCSSHILGNGWTQWCARLSSLLFA